MSVVIYAFRSPGSGAVYIGKREPKEDPRHWPRRGHGRLPDGYGGSGDVVPRFHARHGDRVEWRILAIVPLADWPRAERRAIHLARLLFGRRCVNIRDGGDGWTSEEARAMGLRNAADPDWRAKNSARNKARAKDPEWLEKVSARNKALAADPEWRFKNRAASKALAASPEWRAMVSAHRRAFASTPEGQSQIRHALKMTRSPEALAKLSTINKARAKDPDWLSRNRAGQLRPDTRAKKTAIHKALAQTPERKAQLARASAILRINNSWRRLERERPELFE